MNETTTFQVTSTLLDGSRVTHDFANQTEARAYYTNTDNRALTITQTTTQTKYRIHVPNRHSTEYSVIGAFLTQEEAESALNRDKSLRTEHAYVAKYVSSTIVEITAL